LNDLVDRLCDTINLLTKDIVKSVTHRKRIISTIYLVISISISII